MFTQRIVPVVCGLPCIYDATLRQVGSGAYGEKISAGLIKSDLADRLVNIIRCGNSAQAVAAKLHVSAAEAHTQLIHHSRSEIVSITDQYGLRQSGYVHRISRSSVTGIRIEEVGAVKKVAAHDGVAAQLPIHPVGEVEDVNWCLQNAGHSAKLNTGRAAGNSDGAGTGERCRVGGKRASTRDGVRANLVKRSHTLACREASIKLPQASRRRRKAVTMEDGFSRDVLLVKSTKEENFVLDPRTADGEASKLVI